MTGQAFLITEIKKRLEDVLEIYGHLDLEFGRELDTWEQKKVESTIFDACEDPNDFDLQAIWDRSDKLWVTEAVEAIMFTPPRGRSQDTGRLIKVLEKIQTIAPLVEVFFSVSTPWEWVKQWLEAEQKAGGFVFVYFGEKLGRKKQTIQSLLEKHNAENWTEWEDELNKQSESEFNLMFEPVESLNRYLLLRLLREINSIASIASISLDVTFSIGKTEIVIQKRIQESLERWEWEDYIAGDIEDVQVELTRRTEEEEELEEEELEDEELEDEELEEGERERHKRKTKHLIFEVSVIVEEDEF